MRILKNVFRRKLRAFLTISGITIGVLALVVMGGMAEKINMLVDGGISYYDGKVAITDETSSNPFSAMPMSTDRIAEIEAVDGVARASASLIMMLDEEPGATVGMPPMLLGVDFRADGYEDFAVTFSSGRDLVASDSGVAIVGSDLVGKTGAKVGGTIAVHGETFEVVGIMDKTLTGPDSQVMIPMADAQRLFAATLPAAVRDAIDPSTLASQIVAYPKSGVDADELATRIGDEVAGVTAIGPTDYREQALSQTAMLSSIVYGIALISLLVGGLSVINTMTMAVAERKSEIGVRKAIGATDGAVMRQFIAESGVIGLVGGLAGLAAGALIASGLNAAGNESGTALFLVTSRLAIGSVAFATMLGVLSGLYPAWHAARLNPVQALRAE